MSNAIGKKTMDAILNVTDQLRECVRDSFTPCEGIYRINDFAEYVSEEDWLNVWADHPAWWPRAWLLADNGQFTADQVSRLTVDEIETLFDSPAFEPEYAYFTEADGDGMV